MVQLISDPERKNRILNQFKANKDEKFLMEECFMWTLEPQVWDDIGVIHYPTPPREWVEYENLNEQQKLKMDSSFFNQFAVKEYLQKKSWVYAVNFGHWDWLKKMRDFFPKDSEHLVLHEKLAGKILEFNNWFTNYCPQLEKVKEIFQASEV